MKGPLILYSRSYFSVLMRTTNGVTSMLSRIISDTGIKEIVIVTSLAREKEKLDTEIMLFNKVNDDLAIKLSKPFTQLTVLVQTFKENSIIVVSDVLTEDSLKMLIAGEGAKNLYIYSPKDASYTKVLK